MWGLWTGPSVPILTRWTLIIIALYQTTTLIRIRITWANVRDFELLWPIVVNWVLLFLVHFLFGFLALFDIWHWCLPVRIRGTRRAFQKLRHKVLHTSLLYLCEMAITDLELVTRFSQNVSCWVQRLLKFVFLLLIYVDTFPYAHLRLDQFW